MHPNPFYLATLETSHFSFACIAESRAEALEAMRKAWAKHRHQTGATGSWYEFGDSVNVTKMNVGAVYRDGRKI